MLALNNAKQDFETRAILSLDCISKQLKTIFVAAFGNGGIAKKSYISICDFIMVELFIRIGREDLLK
jgi:hypothetical protein